MDFHLLKPSEAPWEEMDRLEDRVIFQTQEWLDFLADSQGGTPVIAALRDGSVTVGYFSGLLIRRAGIRILGSPFPGWTTSSMGFNLLPGIPRSQALGALEKFAFRELNCLHLEVSDQNCCAEDGRTLGYSFNVHNYYQTDLTPPEEKIFSGFSASRRRDIRLAEKKGIRIEEANDERFADDYYDQLKDVFAKQKLVPTYDRDRAKKLIQRLSPTGRLLLLRARDPEGNCIATGIYPAMNKTAEFWGTASLRSKQHLEPSKLMHWHAIRYWRARGVQRFCWEAGEAGRADFKERWGAETVAVPWFRKSRYRFLEDFRQCAKGVFDLKQRFLGSLHPAPERRTGSLDGSPGIR